MIFILSGIEIIDSLVGNPSKCLTTRPDKIRGGKIVKGTQYLFKFSSTVSGTNSREGSVRMSV